VNSPGGWSRWLSTWFGMRKRSRMLSGPVSAALASWRALAPADLRAPLATQRWLVVDVETTGLDMRRDRLLAIGAVMMEGSAIRYQESFEIVIKQAAPSGADNILIHRIPGSEQLLGVDAADALSAFLTFAQKVPCIAFHAAFDETMLTRAIRENLDIDWAPQFIDLALLAPALVTDAPQGTRDLDAWVAHFGITILARHRAVADALGTAQLFQVLLNRAAAQQIASTETLFKLARSQRWLARINAG
jgi:DNA polymerase III subunit epsilon